MRQRFKVLRSVSKPLLFCCYFTIQSRRILPDPGRQGIRNRYRHILSL